VRPSLRWRLLGLTLPVAVSAVVAAAWVANHQTRLDMREEVNEERRKPEAIIGTLRLLAEQDQGWDGVRERLADVADQHSLRIVVHSPGEGWWADSEEGTARPSTEPIRVDPPDRSAAERQQKEAAWVAFARCLSNGEVAYELPAPDAEGIRKPTVAEGDPAVIRACNEQRTRDLDAASALGATAWGPVDVYLGPTRIESGTLLAGGLSKRLVALIALVAVVTTAVTVLIARRMARPVEALTSAARRMADGHLDERVPEGRSDELGELSRAFNSMAESLAESDRLRRRMTNDVAHELRTPLSNIRGYLEAAQDGVTPLTAELVDSLHEDTLLLQALVNDLQELSLAESGRLRLELHPTDVDDLSRSVVAALEMRAQAAGIRLQVGTAAGRLVPGDPRRLRQVLTNLVENALAHTDPGGRVTVGSRATADGVELTVADTGTGIPAEHLPHVFDRFYRADPSRNRTTGGTGLGLAISRQLVAAHGGEVAVDSVVGEGTTFTVRLPGTAEPAPPTPRPTSRPALPRTPSSPSTPPPAGTGSAPASGAEIGAPNGQTAARDEEPGAANGQAPPRPAPADFTYIDVG
jgi:two-component system, OmpR family, sensor histidine kinase BaeS